MTARNVGAVTEDRPTWIVMFRDVSERVRVQDERSSVLAMVLDAATRLVVSSDFGTSRQSVVDRALKDAVIRPAAPLRKVVPERIVCPPDLADAVAGGRWGLHGQGAPLRLAG